MAATEAMISRLRRMVGEPTPATYTTETLTEILERYPLTDLNGHEKYLYNYTSGSEQVQALNTEWTPTYDLNAAAAEVWEEKASEFAGDFDFRADGGSFDRSQAYEQHMKQARHFRSRRSLRTQASVPTADVSRYADDRSNA